MNSVLTFYFGDWKEIKIGDEVFVGTCGSGRTVFGEHAKLVKILKNHLVFETESKTKVKTKIDNLNHTVGKANEYGYFVSLGRRDESTFIKTETRFY